MPEIIVKLGDNIVQKYFFFQEPLKIGRSTDNEIVIENLAISRNHATIHFEDGHYYLADLESSNGSFVNGVRVKKTEILDKDVISIGKHKLYFYDQRTSDVVHQPSMQDSDRTMLVAPDPEIEAVLVINKGRQKGQRLTLNNGQTTLGRGSDNDLRLTDWFVSKKHAVIERRDKKFLIRDLNSWRHTFVNGVEIEETTLHSGDVILLGPTVELVFQVNADAPENHNESRVPRELESASSHGEHDAPRAAESFENDPSFGESPSFDDAPSFEDSAGIGEFSTSSNPLDDVFGGADGSDGFAPAEEDAFGAEPRDAADEEPNTADLFAEAADSHGQPAAEADASPILSAVQPADCDDAAEGVYEDLADTSLLAAAGAATARGVDDRSQADHANGGENRIDSADGDANDAEKAPVQPCETMDRDREIAMWERALQNKSVTIRKQAARRLKQLTGRDYVL
jgi:pSer/pThr/pTyr-binding forkhead associated (FHA) protein